jgi:hypothetical protein
MAAAELAAERDSITHNHQIQIGGWPQAIQQRISHGSSHQR